MNDLMHLKEMAEYIGISEEYVRKEIKAGRLKARLTGKGYTSLRHIVEEFREKFYGGKE